MKKTAKDKVVVIKIIARINNHLSKFVLRFHQEGFLKKNIPSTLFMKNKIKLCNFLYYYYYFRVTKLFLQVTNIKVTIVTFL